MGVVAATILAMPACADPARPLPAGAASGPAAARSSLKPGKTAGVRQAQETRAGVLLLGAGGVVAGIVAVVAGGGGGIGGQINPQSNSVTVTTTS